MVAALLGLMAGVVALGLGGRSATAREHQAMLGVARELALSRLEAMRSGRGSEAVVTTVEGGVVVRGSARPAERSWTGAGVRLVGGESGVVRFYPSGRASALQMVFAGGASVSGGQGAVGSAGDRIWTIEFDPLSGAVELVRGRRTGSGFTSSEEVVR